MKLLVLAGAAFIGTVVGLWPMFTSPTAAAVEPLYGCEVTDGDTLRCGGERIRLLGIDAPELPSHCREGRTCAPGDPVASSDSLERAILGEDLSIERVAEDRYGRTLAIVTGSQGNLSCWQLHLGQAIYKPRWDDGGRVQRACSADAR